MIDRAFIRLAEGLVHYRHSGERSGDGPPLWMAHAGPGCSRGLVPLIEAFGKSRWTIAPDMLGNGDSDPPAGRETDIAYYADCTVRLLDALHIDQIDFYGTHTGAMIGIELSQTHPNRVRRLILDGVMLLDDKNRAHMVAHYAPAMKPDDHGGQLAWAYQFCRDMMLFYPYFERDAAHRTEGGVPPPDVLHALVVDLLKALGTYHIAYNAAFSYDVARNLPEVRHPTLLTCGGIDPLAGDVELAARLLPSAQSCVHPVGATADQVAARGAVFLTARNDR